MGSFATIPGIGCSYFCYAHTSNWKWGGRQFDAWRNWFSETLNLVRILKAAWKLFFSPWRDHMPHMRSRRFDHLKLDSQ
jgi:hypothetical protein